MLTRMGTAGEAEGDIHMRKTPEHNRYNARGSARETGYLMRSALAMVNPFDWEIARRSETAFQCDSVSGSASRFGSQWTFDCE